MPDSSLTDHGIENPPRLLGIINSTEQAKTPTKTQAIT